MSTTSRYWSDWTTGDFVQAQARGFLQQTIAVLPVAATEQHGPHLPLRVDTALVEGIIKSSLAHLPADVSALFLPVQAVGLSPEHSTFAGTLTLRAQTVIALWTEIAECVAAAGVSKLLLLNTHGGNVGLLDVVARDLRSRLGLLVYSANWWGLPLRDSAGEDVNAMFSDHEHRFGIHAGDIETSLMLALHPDLVNMQFAQNFTSTSQERAAQFPVLGNGLSAKLAWQIQDYNPAGAVGNAAAATLEKGEALLDAAGRGLARLLTEIHELPVDTLKQPNH